MSKDLIFEIGTEELPSSSIIEGISGLKNLLEEKLGQNRIEFDMVKTFGTPRRLSTIVSGVADRQMPQEKIITGPPKKISFNNDGTPTQAALGFARNLGLKVEDLIETENEKGVYLSVKRVEDGENTEKILPRILKDVILSLSFSKQMTWGNYDIKFARPIRWILAFFGPDVINFEIENLTSSNITFGHRNLVPGPIVIKNSSEYPSRLEKEGLIILDPAGRKKQILTSMELLEGKIWQGKFKVVMDEDLINEVVNLVEVPNVLTGNFPEEFLYIPRDILIKAIQYHQRYFAVLDNAGNVSTKFLVIQNGIEDEGGEVIKGNERVLKARLSDARFFYEEDKKHDFNALFEKLKGVIFYKGIGTLYDKELRLAEISAFFTDHLDKIIPGIASLKKGLERASILSKCDLVTNLVVEFPELQGIVGREYAVEKGEDKEVASAIFEHYLPRFKGDILPETEIGSILSIADKIDTITGMFLTENIPSGSQDPFALRRKASGIVLSSLKKNYDFNLTDLVSFTAGLYLNNFELTVTKKENIIVEIVKFIIARYNFLLENENKRTDILNAILGSGCSSITEMDLRYKALEYFINSNGIDMIAMPMVRCKNIIKGRQFSQVEVTLFKEESEKKLYNHFIEMRSIIDCSMKKQEYNDVLLKLSNLGITVNEFFDKVLVMDNDENIKNNRINLIKNVMDIYLVFADFSRIIISSSATGIQNTP